MGDGGDRLVAELTGEDEIGESHEGASLTVREWDGADRRGSNRLEEYSEGSA
jgi:hypothetical protein